MINPDGRPLSRVTTGTNGQLAETHLAIKSGTRILAATLGYIGAFMLGPSRAVLALCTLRRLRSAFGHHQPDPGTCGQAPFPLNVRSERNRSLCTCKADLEGISDGQLPKRWAEKSGQEAEGRSRRPGSRRGCGGTRGPGAPRHRVRPPAPITDGIQDARLTMVTVSSSPPGASAT